MSNGHPNFQPPAGQPPYGQQPPGQPPPGPYGQQHNPYGQPPYGQGFGVPKQRTTNTAVIVLVVAIVLILVVGIVTVALMVRGSGPAPVAPVPAVSTSPAATEPQPSGSPSESAEEPGLTADELGLELESMIRGYREALDDESDPLWDKLDRTEYNQTAVQAMIYFLTDMKAALIWGGSPDDIARYQERTAELEELLMAGKPLGDDIRIKLEDRTFTYDGATGEGGWTKN